MEVRHTVQETETNKAAVCLDILTALPEWFARPQAVADYAQAVECGWLDRVRRSFAPTRVAQRRRRRGEDPRTRAPELHSLKLLGARALADQLDATAVRAALGPLGGMGNTGGRTPGMGWRRSD